MVLTRLHPIVRALTDRISIAKWHKANSLASSGHDQRAIEIYLRIKAPAWLLAICACQAANSNMRLGNMDRAKTLYQDAIRLERNERPKRKRQNSEYITAYAEFFLKSISYEQSKETSIEELLQALERLRKMDVSKSLKRYHLPLPTNDIWGE